jgi:hypothetical protein
MFDNTQWFPNHYEIKKDVFNIASSREHWGSN